MRIIHQFRVQYDGFNNFLWNYLMKFSDRIFLSVQEFENMFLALMRSAQKYDCDVALSFICNFNPKYGQKVREAFTLDDMQYHFDNCDTAQDFVSLIRTVGILGYQEFLPRLHALCATETDGQTLRITNPPLRLSYEIVLEAILFSLGLFKKKLSIEYLSRAWPHANARMRDEIAEVLQSIGADAKSKKLYEEMLIGASQKSVKIMASLLGEVGDKDTGLFLKKLTSDIHNSMYLRDAAFGALQAIQIRLRERFY
jgi:hypothetical protein